MYKSVFLVDFAYPTTKLLTRLLLVISAVLITQLTLRNDCLMVKIAGIASGLSSVLGSTQVACICPFQVPLRFGKGTNQYLKIQSFHRKLNKNSAEYKVN